MSNSLATASPVSTPTDAQASPAQQPDTQATLAPEGQDSQPAAQQQAEGQDTQPAAAEQDKPNRSQIRYGEIHRKWKEAESTAARAHAEVRRLQEQISRMPAVDADADPTSAIAQQSVKLMRQSQIEDQQAQARAAQTQAEANMVQAWNEKVDEARAVIPDFDQVVTQHTPIHPLAAPILAESPVGAQMAYWLGKNPAEAMRIADLCQYNPRQGLFELGKLEARVSTPLGRQTSNAPKPAPILNGGPAPTAFDPEKSSMAEYMADFKRREDQRLGIKR